MTEANGPDEPFVDYLAPFETFQAYGLRRATLYRGRIRPEFAADRERLDRILDAAPGEHTLEEIDGRLYATLRVDYGRRPPRRLWLHIALLLITLVTTLAAGSNLVRGNWVHGTTVWPFHGAADWVAWTAVGKGGEFMGVQWPELRDALLAGVPYAAALLFILLSHEMGHYLAARRHGIDATLPFLLPAPFFFGTFGAIIRMRSPITHRRALFDVGAAGPLAGLVASLVVCVIGVAQSQYAPASTGAGVRLGESLLLRGIIRVVLGPKPPMHDVLLSPVGVAGWFGLLITFLNLMPMGQLDGGHIWYALVGRRQRVVGWVGMLVTVGMGFLFPGWLLLALLVMVLLRVEHPPVMDESVRLDPGRVLLGGVIVAAFILMFVPKPIDIVTF